jgi:hypothetical protein
MNVGALPPRQAHPATSNRDTMKTGPSVASNATHRREPVHKTDHDRQNQTMLMNRSG